MNLLSYLMIVISIVFWIFRVVCAYTYSANIDFILQPLNFNMEVILLFVTLICIVLIIKRNLFGAIAYFISYLIYFGIDAYKKINIILQGTNGTINYLSFIVSAIGILIPFIILIDILLNKNKSSSKKNRKTDWFYKNDKYEKKQDSRVDLNQYKL